MFDGHAAGVAYPDTMRLILASASPSRLRLLRAAGIEPEVIVSGVDEEILTSAMPDAGPEAVARVLAQAKARDVAAQHPGRLVLGADSVLDVDGRSLGKPGTAQVATARWHEIRGRSAALITGHCLIHPGGEEVASARTVVHFAFPDDAEIAAYVATCSGSPVGSPSMGMGRRSCAGSRGTRPMSSASGSRCCATWCAGPGCRGPICGPDQDQQSVGAEGWEIAAQDRSND